MTASILRHTSPRLRERGARNNAGGPTHVVDNWSRLARFLTIGTEGGTYYVDEKKHTLKNIQSLDACLTEDYKRAIDLIVDISDAGRAPKNDYAIYALARAAAHKNDKVRAYALSKLEKVCRTGTHLFQFVESVDSMRGWGSGLRKAVARWFTSRDADGLAYQVLKYGQRGGWSMRDVLRLAHPTPPTPAHDAVFQYVTQGTRDLFHTPVLINTVEQIKAQNDPTETAYAIKHHGVSREMIPTEHMNSLVVQQALAEKMPYTALMRNLGNLSRHGAIDRHNQQDIVARLTDESYIKKSRVHPISILTALRTYAQGTGFRGTNSWSVNGYLTKALDKAFYLAFKNVEPTGKRFYIGVDVSGSMSSRIYNGVLTSTEVAAALSMVLVRTEPWTKVDGFNHGLTPLNFTYLDTLEQAMHKARGVNYGGTDAALLIDHATKQGLEVDCFVVITDNETWVRGRKPSDALRDYRRKMNRPDTKLVVLATAATEFSIADPSDPGMLDISGFDSSVPEVIRGFVNNEF